MNTVKDAARFQFLQNINPKDAQAFFWNFTSRHERAQAIDRAMQCRETQRLTTAEKIEIDYAHGLGGD